LGFLFWCFEEIVTLREDGPAYTHAHTGDGEVSDMARSHGELLGLVPYDFRFPSLRRVGLRLWNAEDRRFVVPTIFGVGWTLNLRNAPRHPVQAALVAAFVLWRIRARRGR
jgi:hypothetical protein